MLDQGCGGAHDCLVVTLLVALELFELVVAPALDAVVPSDAVVDDVDVAGCAELDATVDALRAASAGS